MKRHIDYFEMVDALKADVVCPVCYLIDKSVENYIDSFLYEGVNDVGMRKSIKYANGFCNYHAWKLREHGDPLAHAILYSDLIENVLRGNISEKIQPKEKCPLCSNELEAEERYLSTLKDALYDDDFKDLYVNYGGLCMNHFYSLIKLLPVKDERRDIVTSIQRKRLETILMHLKEIIRKSDYRFSSEPWGDEKDAWIRAVYMWAGRR